MTKTYKPELWQLTHILKDPCPEDLLVNRTNNPLERYNRTLAECFSHCTRPTMTEFVRVIRQEGLRLSELYDFTNTGKKPKPCRPEIYIPVLPEDY